ncbi:MAG: cupin domain-containing protein [Solirubrobacterales bacterium]
MTRTGVPEAKLVETEGGMKPEGDGWFVVNMANAMATGIDEGLYGFIFEAPRTFPHFGINVRVLAPGRPAAMYHAEAGQEAFLVLDGECTLIVEGEERTLRQWDFVHCPPNTAHVIVGAGDAPCVVLMVGARNAGEDLIYPVDPVAAKHGASVEEDTGDPAEAYAGWTRPTPRRFPWPPS